MLMKSDIIIIAMITEQIIRFVFYFSLLLEEKRASIRSIKVESGLYQKEKKKKKAESGNGRMKQVVGFQIQMSN